MRVLIILLLCLSQALMARANDTASQAHIRAVVASAVNEHFPLIDFYFIGQAHKNKANALLEKELLFSLHKKAGVRYHILEFGHSVAVIFNEYLATGNDSLLTYLKPGASFSVLKAVKEFNSKLDRQEQIKFYGIDFESRESDRYIEKAIRIILDRTQLSSSHPLYKNLQAISAHGKDNKRLLDQIATYLNINEQKCRIDLKDYYTDLMLIANARYEFRPRRDGHMFDNFCRLYKELSLTDQQPRFFCSIGYAHVNPDNSNGLFRHLNNRENSPVRASTGVIGIEYYNSAFQNKSRELWTGHLKASCLDEGFRRLFIDPYDSQNSINFLTYYDLKNNLDARCYSAKLIGLMLVIGFEGSEHMWD